MVLCTSKDKAILYKAPENKRIRPTTPTSSRHACSTRLIVSLKPSVFQRAAALDWVSVCW